MERITSGPRPFVISIYILGCVSSEHKEACFQVTMLGCPDMFSTDMFSTYTYSNAVQSRLMYYISSELPYNLITDLYIFRQ